MLQEQDIWKYIQNEQIKQLPKLSSYGRKYKQYLNNDCSLTTINTMKIQLKFFNQNVIDTIELLCEMDVLNQFNSIGQQSNLNQKVKHIYEKHYFYVHSFRHSRNNLPTFLYWLNQFITNFHTTNNINRKYSLILNFKLAFDVYVSHFQIKKSLH